MRPKRAKRAWDRALKAGEYKFSTYLSCALEDRQLRGIAVAITEEERPRSGEMMLVCSRGGNCDSPQAYERYTRELLFRLAEMYPDILQLTPRGTELKQVMAQEQKQYRELMK